MNILLSEIKPSGTGRMATYITNAQIVGKPPEKAGDKFAYTEDDPKNKVNAIAIEIDGNVIRASNIKEKDNVKKSTKKPK